jgi:hypothetical protein
LYKYKALWLSYENASIFAAFALAAFNRESPFQKRMGDARFFGHDKVNMRGAYVQCFEI